MIRLKKGYVIFASLVLLVPGVRSGTAERGTAASPGLASEERLDGYTLSPDGQLLAYFGSSGVWVTTLTNRTHRLLVSQHALGSRYPFEMKWSFSGRRLAMVLDRPAGPGIAIWDRRTNAVRQVLEQELHISPWGHMFFEWLDDRRILCAALPRGHHFHGSEAVATQGWSDARKGNVPTVSVLESGVPGHFDDEKQTEFLIIDVDSGVVGRYDAGILARASLGPDRKHIAFLRQEARSEDNPEYELLEQSVNSYILTVLKLNDAGHIVKDYEYLLRSRFPDRPWIEWGPDGKHMAVSAQSDPGPLQWYVCGESARDCEELKGGGVIGAIQDIRWTASGELLAYGERANSDVTARTSERHDWWLLAGGGSPKNVTADLPQNVEQGFVSREDGNGFVFLSGGDLWSFGPDIKGPARITVGFNKKIDRFVWPVSTEVHALAREAVVATTKDQDGKEALYSVSTQSGKAHELFKPEPDSEFVERSTASGVDLFQARRSGALRAWSCKTSENTCELLVEAEGARTPTGESLEIRYRSLKGEALTGVLRLPADYRKGIKYPMVTLVYGGLVYGDLMATNSFDGPLTAHGYAVLLPSMPLSPPGTPSDPCTEILNGVLPAVDKAIDMGIADSARLGVMGHSYGGYSTYCIIGQTNRFKAAVALAGISDLISDYGVFGASRYASVQDMAGLMENGQGRMGSPPWKDPNRYIRNSPIFYVERIETPVMIVQGDEDTVSIEQGEEMFSALKRENKRAEFVRYWGEGHEVERSPANEQDQWSRIYAWFDQFFANRQHN